jgi:alpha-beta hydrolase superfamily lysophospholipase
MIKNINKIQYCILYLLLIGSSSTCKAKETYFLFAHGIADNHKQAYLYTKHDQRGKINTNFIMPDSVFTFDFPDATTHFWRVNFTKTSLGQANEILALYKAYNSMLETLKTQNITDPHIILFGLSRGASTVINFMGLFNPLNVKALILESPFDTPQNLIKNLLAKANLDHIPGLSTIAYNILSNIFMQHNKYGLQPLDMATYIPKEMPILLICSKEDGTVPYASTVALYNRLIETGHKKAHLLVLNIGKHSKLISGPEGNKYQQVVHAFYKKYGLEYDHDLAKRGQNFLNQSNKDLK